MDLKPEHHWVKIQLTKRDHAKLKSFCALAEKNQTDFIAQLLADYETLQQTKGQND